MSARSTALILEELGAALSRLDEQTYEVFLQELMTPGRRILLMAVGRVMISLKAWVKRLAQLDIDINYVGSENEMPLHQGDLLIVGSSSGESALPVQIASIAKKIGAKVAYVGCSPQSTVAGLADTKLILLGRTKFGAETEFQSRQPMSTLFEQQLFLLCDVIALDIMQRRGWTEEDIKSRHANME